MDSSVKDKHIILGFIGFTICLISFFITLIVAESFNQDNFVRLIVFLCSNLLGWLFYLSFQTIIFECAYISFRAICYIDYCNEIGFQAKTVQIHIFFILQSLPKSILIFCC